jgi:hypothetical protein
MASVFGCRQLQTFGSGQQARGEQERVRRVDSGQPPFAGDDMSTRTILIVVVLLLLLGALPTWPYSAGWGYYPSGGLGLVLLILVVLLLVGRI